MINEANQHPQRATHTNSIQVETDHPHIKEHKSTGAQEHKCTRAQVHKSTGAHEHMSTGEKTKHRKERASVKRL